MAQDLNDTAEAAGRDYRVHVTEECLNGRRTAFEDPYKPGRSGLIGIQQVIEAQSPLDVVIIMLGTNDFQSIHRHTPWHSAMGIAAIIDAIRATTLEPEIPVPKILVVAPPALDHPRADRAEVTGGEYRDRRGWRMRCGRSRRSMGAGFRREFGGSQAARSTGCI